LPNQGALHPMRGKETRRIHWKKARAFLHLTAAKGGEASAVLDWKKEIEGLRPSRHRKKGKAFLISIQRGKKNGTSFLIREGGVMCSTIGEKKRGKPDQFRTKKGD